MPSRPPPRPPKPVDEDLYKIPPDDLLYTSKRVGTSIPISSFFFLTNLLPFFISFFCRYLLVIFYFKKNKKMIYEKEKDTFEIAFKEFKNVLYIQKIGL
jgi:hypothetical protein